jgi:hypothetical protein
LSKKFDEMFGKLKQIVDDHHQCQPQNPNHTVVKFGLITIFLIWFAYFIKITIFYLTMKFVQRIFG